MVKKILILLILVSLDASASKDPDGELDISWWCYPEVKDLNEIASLWDYRRVVFKVRQTIDKT